MKSGDSATRRILSDSARNGVGGISIAGGAATIQVALVVMKVPVESSGRPTPAVPP